MALMTDIDVAVLCLCLMESICRFGSCYLHQNRFPDHSLCYRCDIAFHFSSVVVAALLGSGFVGFEHSKALQS
jgi:hypothetical protein